MTFSSQKNIIKKVDAQIKDQLIDKHGKNSLKAKIAQRFKAKLVDEHIMQINGGKLETSLLSQEQICQHLGDQVVYEKTLNNSEYGLHMNLNENQLLFRGII